MFEDDGASGRTRSQNAELIVWCRNHADALGRPIIGAARMGREAERRPGRSPATSSVTPSPPLEADQ